MEPTPLIVLHNYPLKALNTFGISCQARYFAEVHSLHQLVHAIQSGLIRKYATEGLLVLGGGSNLLFTHSFEGLVLHICIPGKEIIHDDPDSVVVRVGAGENWNDFVGWCVANGLGGIENLSLIPGKVGSAPVQNIGAYGVEVASCIQGVHCVVLASGQEVYYPRAACGFGYRESIFKHQLRGEMIITGVDFVFSKNYRPNLEYSVLAQTFQHINPQSVTPFMVQQAVNAIRSSKLPDPLVLPNAGSFFKNPLVTLRQLDHIKKQFPAVVSYPAENQHAKLAAAWLIEQCGLKGYRQGECGVHSAQALVLVNYGKATGLEILALAQKLKESVFEKFGVALEMEVNVI